MQHLAKSFKQMLAGTIRLDLALNSVNVAQNNAHSGPPREFMGLRINDNEEPLSPCKHNRHG